MTGTREGRWVPVSWARAWTLGNRIHPLLPGGPWGLPKDRVALMPPLQDTGDAVLRPPARSQADLGAEPALP